MKDAINIISLIIYSLIAISSIVVIQTGTMVHGNMFNFFAIYRTNNFYEHVDCNFYSDFADQQIEPINYNLLKKLTNKCKRIKALSALEYSAFIIDLVLALFSIILLSFCSYGERKIIILSIISIIITLVYASFNGYILCNDCPGIIQPYELYNINKNSRSFTPFDILETGLLRTNSEGAFAELDPNTENYTLLFPMQDETDICGPFFKYKDLGSKFINYNKDLYFAKKDEEIEKCYSREISKIYEGLYKKKTYFDSEGNLKTCKYLYHNEATNFKSFKNIYSRMVVSLVLSCFISLSHIILIILSFIY